MSQIPAPCSGQFPDTLRHQHVQTRRPVFVSGIHKERNIQVCATLNGIVKIIKAQNLSFFVTGSFKPSGLFPPAPQK
ncbi:putative transposase [Shigella flexneri K-218]|nr:putative transposase [Shigella flexneri K-218]